MLVVTRDQWNKTGGKYLPAVEYTAQDNRQPSINGGILQTKVTHEYMVTGFRGPFAEPGDSGALVFDEEGNVLCLLVGGFERKDNAYVTHIQEVFDDCSMISR